MQRRFKRSGLDDKPTLVDFDWRFNPKLPRTACFELHTLKFIAEGSNALVVGKPGTGKSHLAKAVAYQATLQGYDVRYLEADAEFSRYALATTDERTRLLKEWVEPDLLVLDDLFLARRMAETATEVLQLIVHQRYKLRRSVVITSNRVVQDWGRTWVTPPWLPPSWTGSCTAARCWSSRARAIAWKRPLHASPSAQKPHNSSVVPGELWGGHRWGNLTWPSGNFLILSKLIRISDEAQLRIGNLGLHLDMLQMVLLATTRCSNSIVLVVCLMALDCAQLHEWVVCAACRGWQ